MPNMRTLRDNCGTPLEDLAIAAHGNPQHPDYEFYKIFGPEIIKRAIATEEAENDADKFLALITDRFVANIEKHPPLSAEAVLFIIGKITPETQIIVQKTISKRQSEIAKNKRPSRQHKEKPKVLKYWNDWQDKPSLYSIESDFIRDMQEKTEINRAQTIRVWIKQFKKTPSRLSEIS